MITLRVRKGEKKVKRTTAVRVAFGTPHQSPESSQTGNTGEKEDDTFFRKTKSIPFVEGSLGRLHVPPPKTVCLGRSILIQYGRDVNVGGPTW